MGDVKKASNGQAMKPAPERQDSPEIKGLEARHVASLTTEARESESVALDRVDQNLDHNVLDHLEIRYGDYIPQERLAAERHQLTQIQGKAELQQDLAGKFPELSPPERDAILGYCAGDERHIERNIQTPSTLLHERLHGVSHPEARNILGNHLYEGITEDLATQHPEFHLKLQDLPECYPENRETVTLLKARLPESALYEAYFKGDDSRIKGFVDHDLGEGSWSRVKELLAQAEGGNREALHEAKKILKQNN